MYRATHIPISHSSKVSVKYIIQSHSTRGARTHRYLSFVVDVVPCHQSSDDESIRFDPVKQKKLDDQ